MSGQQEFHYYQGVGPMMWVIFALSLVELFAVHFFVALKWPMIGWPLTFFSVIGAIWIFFWIRSFRSRPHILKGEMLCLQFGNLKAVELDLANIDKVTRGWEQGAVKAKGSMNLAGIAYPNRCIELIEPFARGRNRIFLRLDRPDEFDAALTGRGVAFVP